MKCHKTSIENNFFHNGWNLSLGKRKYLEIISDFITRLHPSPKPTKWFVLEFSRQGRVWLENQKQAEPLLNFWSCLSQQLHGRRRAASAAITPSVTQPHTQTHTYLCSWVTSLTQCNIRERWQIYCWDTPIGNVIKEDTHSPTHTDKCVETKLYFEKIMKR